MKEPMTTEQVVVGWTISLLLLGLFAFDLILLLVRGEPATVSVVCRQLTDRWGAMPIFFAMLAGWAVGHVFC